MKIMNKKILYDILKYYYYQFAEDLEELFHQLNFEEQLVSHGVDYQLHYILLIHREQYVVMTWLSS